METHPKKSEKEGVEGLDAFKFSLALKLYTIGASGIYTTGDSIRYPCS